LIEKSETVMKLFTLVLYLTIIKSDSVGVEKKGSFNIITYLPSIVIIFVSVENPTDFGFVEEIKRFGADGNV